MHRQVFHTDETHYQGPDAGYDVADVSFRSDQPHTGYHQQYQHTTGPQPMGLSQSMGLPQPMEQPRMVQPIYARQMTSNHHQPYSYPSYSQPAPAYASHQAQHYTRQMSMQSQPQVLAPQARGMYRPGAEYHLRQPLRPAMAVSPLPTLPASSVPNPSARPQWEQQFQFAQYGSTQTMRSATQYDSGRTMTSAPPPLRKARSGPMPDANGHTPDWWQLSSTRAQAWNQLQGTLHVHLSPCETGD